ncbi:MAG TPA: hypothetical protein ENJ83_02415 [Rhodospirillales bacterium]|nr:hypothetical protein [Rhodospirillales bacterium]
MKAWQKWTLTGAAALLVGGAILTGGAYADPDHDEGYGRGGMMGRMMGRMGMMGDGMGAMGRGGPAAMLRSFDLDGDGRVTRDEALRARTEQLGKYDTDGDGKLSLQEYEQAWLDSTRPMMVRRFQMHDSDADGRVTREEFGAVVDRMFWRFDRNGDGAIERKEMRRMMKHRRYDDD